MSSESYYIGIDVGTGSARAGLVKSDGTLIASSTQDTKTWRDPQDHRIFEQSTTDIWDRISTAVKTVLAESKVSPKDVKGLGFDATCSLAVTDFNGEPVSVSKGKETLGIKGERNIILWADHRAEKEAELINSKHSVPLDFVGGVMSLEMEIPKILWLKNNMSQSSFDSCQFFDLPDWLTYRATGNNVRSICSITCKCSYVPSKGGWQTEFFDRIGLSVLHERNYKQMGATRTANDFKGQGGGGRFGEEEGDVLTAGTPVGKGLSKKAAEELGLVEGTPVGSGVIDAYAGWLGTVAARHEEKGKLSELVSFEESGHRLAAVAGTSTCHIVQSKEGVFVPGVWGPYRDPVFPGWWMNEGGQSSTGQLIDFMITTHPAYPELKEVAAQRKTNIHQVLRDTLEEIRKSEGADSFTEVIKDMHFYPDLHGNRSPIADPRMRGSLMGLTLDASLQDLARKYALALEAIALQTNHILTQLNVSGHSITSIYMSGSQAQNAFLMSLLANACNVPVVLPHSYSAAVVLGAAMLGRFAAEYAEAESGSAKVKKISSEQDHCERLWDIMVKMTPKGSIVKPEASAKDKKILEAKYKIFLESIDIQKKWRKQIEEAAQ